MGVNVITAAEAAARLDEFDAVIDVRSPAEYAEDRLPGAVNWPVLDDDERRLVGTLYTQVSPLEARKQGAALVARNVARHLEREAPHLAREWRPLVYCWRGGQRSGTLVWFLGQIGFRTAQLAGGYKAFRGLVRADLETLPAAHQWRVLCGRTGSGKTRLLHALAATGAQTVDLEALACHRGSVLGAVPGRPQPSQKAFDTALWRDLRRLDPARPVFVESESQKIGRLRVPDALIERMRAAPCSVIEMADDARTQLLLEDYAAFTEDPESFCRLLEPLTELRGKQMVQGWQEGARAGRFADVFGDLMRRHYDPLYDKSIRAHYARLAEAQRIVLAGGDAPALRQAAAQLITGAGEAGPAASGASQMPHPFAR